MKKSRKANLNKIICTTIVALCVVWMYVSSNWDAQMPQVEKYRVLCDAFFLPGSLLLCFAILMSINNAGGLDALAYLMSYIPRIFAPGLFGEKQDYLDYVEERREKRDSAKGYGFLYLVGSVFFGIALVFLALYYCV